LKQHAPLQQPVLERPPSDDVTRHSSPTVTSNDHTDDKNGVLEGSDAVHAPVPTSDESMQPPAPPRWRAGSTQGVQTYVTTISVGNSSRTLEANPQMVPTASGDQETAQSSTGHGHHRKLSSFSNLGPLLFGVPGDANEHPLKNGGGAHHRSTSSTVSFLHSLDVLGGVNDTDATFLRNLQATTGAPPAAFNSASAPDVKPGALSHRGVAFKDDNEKKDTSSKLASGGTSKRVRRKCTVNACENRVVQGGLCIAHGAKRKQCKHPGCTKHVKKAGLCSTHGPARRRCDAEGCTKVAVQGGRCIAHGAKKKLCSVDQCTKQAILGGMCKKHHDQSQQNSTAPPQGVDPSVCQVVNSKKPDATHSSKMSTESTASKKPTHTRGLSIFQEISADTVGDLLSGENPAAAAPVPAPAPGRLPPTHRHRSTFSRDFANLY
jgi:hypothetical protein